MQHCILIMVRYPKFLGWAGFLSMAIFRLSLWLNKKITFWKLMGCGKNGTFSKTPDWLQWSLLYTIDAAEIDINNLDNTKTEIFIQQQTPFIHNYWKFFNCEVYTLLLQPIEGHGYWDGKQPMGKLPKQTDYDGTIGILTRATIKLSKLNSFWKNVDGVANKMATADGFITSFGIGEIPWLKQATFSIWESKEQMKNFAYSMKEHKEVIQKTRKEAWYKEDLFVRFKILGSYGSINGINPLKRNP